MPTFHHKSRSHLVACNALGSPETWFGFLLDKQQVVKHFLTSPRLKGSIGNGVYSGYHASTATGVRPRGFVCFACCAGARWRCHRRTKYVLQAVVMVLAFFFRKSGVHKILSDTDTQIVESEVRYFGELD